MFCASAMLRSRAVAARALGRIRPLLLLPELSQDGTGYI